MARQPAIPLRDLKRALTERLVERAVDAARRGECLEALDVLRRCEDLPSRIPTRHRPIIAEVFYQTAKEALSRHQTLEAFKRLHDAVTIRHDHPWAAERLGLMRSANLPIDTTAIKKAQSLGIAPGPIWLPEWIGLQSTHALGAYRAYAPDSWTTRVREFKQQSHPAMADPLGFLMAAYVWTRPELLASIDLLLPVPPHPRKFYKRGYAPTDLLATALGRYLGIPVRLDVLLRDANAPDTQEATFEEVRRTYRLGNVGRWAAVSPRVLLIEDVITRGKNVAACVALLRSIGICQVSALSLSQTQG